MCLLLQVAPVSQKAITHVWAYGVVVSTFVFHCGYQCSNPGWAVKFHVANLYVNSALRQ